jgi:hypothetical protein
MLRDIIGYFTDYGSLSSHYTVAIVIACSVVIHLMTVLWFYLFFGA